MDADHPAVSDPAIDPESGESYKVLFERALRELLFVLALLRDTIDRKAPTKQ